MNTRDTDLIDLALQEDLGNPYQDVTTDLLFTQPRSIARANIRSKHPESITVCGLSLAETLIQKLDKSCEIESSFKDGDIISTGDTILTLTGSPQTLLKIERTLLNFLQHLSAVATLTRKFVDKIKHTPAQILDTRKTLPGFRRLDKYAVRCGGGVNHRMGLYDAILIKDTHIDALGNISLALDKIPDDIKNTYPVIIEIRNLNELELTLKTAAHKISRVLLDNMSLDELRRCVSLCKNVLPTEASGNINLNTVTAVAETGVDFISVGQLTHSAGSVDLSMTCEL